uniref:Uncharacterized protein n=1 Tax=Myoviridae sp. ctncN39 TaxID=2825170 RepID=A0A8S5V280_9CAUD|nr:MAG TPA: hypothetical protein [Myoviridae sp. ctncN39]
MQMYFKFLLLLFLVEKSFLQSKLLLLSSKR